MKQCISIVIMLSVFTSCSNQFKADYYFPNNASGFYVVIFNSPTGTVSQKSKNVYEFNFEQSNIILVKEPQIQGIGQVHYYIMDKGGKSNEITNDKLKAKNSDVIVSINNISSYTNAKTKKQVDYEMFWLAFNKKMGYKEQIEEDKRQNIQIELLHQKIDSLVNIGLL